MKYLTALFLKILLLSNFVMAETISTKSKILEKSSECLTDLQNHVCEKLVFEIEKLQSVEFDQNRFKCQSSLLGLQSEIIEAHFFKNSKKKQTSLMIPHVIKNC